MLSIGIAEIVGLGGLLTTVIGYLWRRDLNHANENKERLKTSESKHEKAREELKDLHGKVERLSGEREGFEAGVERISALVLEEIRSKKNGG